MSAKRTGRQISVVVQVKWGNLDSGMPMTLQDIDDLEFTVY